MLTEVEVGLASVRWWCKKFPPVYRYRVEWEMILVVITCLVAGLDRRTWHKQCDARVTATHNGTQAGRANRREESKTGSSGSDLQLQPSGLIHHVSGGGGSLGLENVQLNI